MWAAMSVHTLFHDPTPVIHKSTAHSVPFNSSVLYNFYAFWMTEPERRTTLCPKVNISPSMIVNLSRWVCKKDAIFNKSHAKLVKIRQQFPKKSESTELHDEQLHLIHAVNLRIVTMTEIFVLRVVGITMDIAVDARLRNAMKFVRISRNRFAVM